MAEVSETNVSATVSIAQVPGIVTVTGMGKNGYAYALKLSTTWRAIGNVIFTDSR
jgi:hypothetical protein